jgi:GDP-mannose 6-dehydrogenase
MATVDGREAALDADLAIICVGTPSRPGGSLNLDYVEKVCTQLGGFIRERSKPLLVVLRSTMVPGSMREVVLPTLERAAGEPPGRLYKVLFHPEFLREGSSIKDFNEPPKIVVGECQTGDGAALLELYSDRFVAPRIVCSVEVAEMVKYCDNLFHAVKITFGNEIGQFCHAHGIDSQEVMRVFCEDRKLNISPCYLMPGFAFGGSCLPKDLRAFLSVAKDKELSLNMLSGVLPSNQQQISRALGMILDEGAREIGFHGLAFKAGTDDLRESPYVELGERLLGKGKELVFYDSHVHVSRLVGENKSYVEQIFPHLSEMVTGEVSDLDGCELIVLCHRADAGVIKGWSEKGLRVIDLTGLFSASLEAGIRSVV